jgi:hypothetical protein
MGKQVPRELFAESTCREGERGHLRAIYIARSAGAPSHLS